MKYISKNQTETILYGKQLASKLKSGDILLLQGNLGSGKTTLAKGIAQGLGIKNEITSPTFTLMNVYNTKTLQHKNIEIFIHVDTYRLENKYDLINIGIEDYLGQPNTICIIEWPNKIADLLSNYKTISISIEYLSKNKRNIEINR